MTTPAADRSHGGPGSSHQNAKKPAPEVERKNEAAGTRDRSWRSGGGELDSHHIHDPWTKG